MIDDIARLNGLHELTVVRRAIRRCKWYEIRKRKTLRVHEELIQKIYDI